MRTLYSVHTATYNIKQTAETEYRFTVGTEISNIFNWKYAITREDFVKNSPPKDYSILSVIVNSETRNTNSNTEVLMFLINKQ